MQSKCCCGKGLNAKFDSNSKEKWQQKNIMNEQIAIKDFIRTYVSMYHCSISMSKSKRFHSVGRCATYQCTVRPSWIVVNQETSDYLYSDDVNDMIIQFYHNILNGRQMDVYCALKATHREIHIPDAECKWRVADRFFFELIK